jgi:hypothetical protein
MVLAVPDSRVAVRPTCNSSASVDFHNEGLWNSTLVERGPSMFK